MKPKITETISGYRFEWESDSLVIDVSRVKIHNDGRITGNVKLILGKEKHTEPSFTLNFSSSPTRKQLTNSLNQKFPDWEWLPIIDELCRQVQELSQQGEPIKELWTSATIDEPKMILDPLLIEGLPTIIFGEKGVAKSQLTQLTYICLTLPWDDNPFGFGVPEQPTRTVILDWELPGKIAQWNMKRIVEGQGLKDLPLYHRKCSLPLADDLDKIAYFLEDLAAEVIIIDSLARACGGDIMKDTDNVNRFFLALEKLGLTSLIIGQTSKADDKSKTIYGNVMFQYYARSIFELCKSEGLGEELNVALFHRWSNLTGLHEPMGFHFSYNGNKTFIESQAVSYAEFLSKVNRQRQVLELLRSGSKLPKEIQEALEMSRASLDVTTKKLRDKGLIIKLADGSFGLKVS